MLRLTAVSRADGEVVLAVVGWLEGKDVALLEREIDRELAGSRRLVLDLGGTRAIDPAGLDALARRSSTGVALRGGSAFVRALLQTRGLSSDQAGPPAAPSPANGTRRRGGEG